MRRIIYYVAASLDGCIARDDGAVDWLPVPTGRQDYGYAAFLRRVDTLVFGRKTYEQALGLGDWPYAERACYVFSRKWAGQHDARARFVGGDVARLLRRLKRQPGKDIWLVGGSEGAHACFEAGLVDEMILTLVPIVLGGGRPLFLRSPAARRFKLRRSRAFADGLVQLHYTVAA